MKSLFLRIWHNDITPVRQLLENQQFILENVYFAGEDFNTQSNYALEKLKSGVPDQIRDIVEEMRARAKGEFNYYEAGYEMPADVAGPLDLQSPNFLFRMGDYVKFVVDICKQDPTALVISLNAANAHHPGGAAAYGPGSAEEAFARKSNLLIELILNHTHGERQQRLLIALFEASMEMKIAENDAQKKDIAEKFRQDTIDLILQENDDYHIPKDVARDLHINEGVYVVETKEDGTKQLHHSVTVDIAGADLRPMSSDINFKEKVKSVLNMQELSEEQIQQLSASLEAYIQSGLQLAEKNPDRSIYLNMLPIGCGAFKNPPDVIANLIKDLLLKYRDQLARYKIFTVFSSFPDNFATFQQVFSDDAFNEKFNVVLRREKVLFESSFNWVNKSEKYGVEFLMPEEDPDKFRFRFVQGSLQHLQPDVYQVVSVVEDKRKHARPAAIDNPRRIEVVLPQFEQSHEATDDLIKKYTETLAALNASAEADDKKINVVLAFPDINNGWPLDIVISALQNVIVQNHANFTNTQSLTIMCDKAGPLNQLLKEMQRDAQPKVEEGPSAEAIIADIKQLVKEQNIAYGEEKNCEIIAAIIVDQIREKVTSPGVLKEIFDAIGIGRGDQQGDDHNLKMLRHRKRRFKSSPWRETNDSDAVRVAGIEKMKEILVSRKFEVDSPQEYTAFELIFDEAADHRWLESHVIRGYDALENQAKNDVEAMVF